MIAISTPPDSVKVYSWDDNSESWTQIGQTIIIEEEIDISGFWIDLSGDGNTLAVSTRDNDYWTKAVVYTLVKDSSSSSYSWVQMGNDIVGRESCGGYGRHVVLSRDGLTVAGFDRYGDLEVYIFNQNEWEMLFEKEFDCVHYDSFKSRENSPLDLSSDGRTVASSWTSSTHGDSTGYAGNSDIRSYSEGSWKYGRGFSGRVPGGGEYERNFFGGGGVSLSSLGDVAAVGENEDYTAEIFYDDDVPTVVSSDVREVYIFAREGEEWKQVGQTIGESRPFVVELSNDGCILLVKGEEDGHHLYSLDGNLWVSQSESLGGSSAAMSKDGSVVAIVEDIAMANSTVKVFKIQL